MKRRTSFVLFALVGLLALLATAVSATEQPELASTLDAAAEVAPMETVLNADGTIPVPEWTLPTGNSFNCVYTCEECFIACQGQPSCEVFCIIGPCAMGC